jgi:hypothetical protein
VCSDKGSLRIGSPEEYSSTAGQAKEPSRKLIVEWLVEVYTNIPVGMGWNAWKKRGYEWVY